MYAVTDPSTGTTAQTYPTATDTEVTAAVDAAHAATTWGRNSSVAERATLLRRLGDLHSRHRADLAHSIVREMGKPLKEAEGEIDFCADIYHYYADHAEQFLADEELDVTSGPGRAVIRRSPVGVLLGIMPWNFPAYQVARFAAPNLALGNTIVLKHAPQCPATAALLEKLCTEAGLPAGAYVNVYATNEQIAQVIADPRVQGVSLTGSERAGAAVAEIAGRHLKKVVLELGGSDPFIVLSTDDLDSVVEAAVSARLENTGQACNAAKRFVVVSEEGRAHGQAWLCPRAFPSLPSPNSRTCVLTYSRTRRPSPGFTAPPQPFDGKDVEVLYLRLMTAHHKDGVDMARDAVRPTTPRSSGSRRPRSTGSGRSWT
ncbi:aldehyde dehydrogenase family protein [Streptomyces sp. NPDC001292]|uniref:aldehyde dehydrogenase family protein n=1 Tax=Streptomyces sp. NPDC001292 TaxID=3364558 RepID=UPI0036947A71